MRRPLQTSEAFQVVRVPFPFSEGLAVKRRPAVVLSKPSFQQRSGHLLLAMVTSGGRSTWPLDWRIVDLQAAGLKQPCLIRMKLFTLDERLLLEPLGKLEVVDQKGLESRLADLIATPMATGA